MGRSNEKAETIHGGRPKQQVNKFYGNAYSCCSLRSISSPFFLSRFIHMFLIKRLRCIIRPLDILAPIFFEF